MGSLHWALVCVAACAAIAGCKGGVPAGHPAAGGVEQVRKAIRSAMSRNHIVGMSAVAIVGDTEVLCEGFGFADRGQRVPVTRDSLFPLASVTKLFTATAVMQLVEQGAVDLDTPVSRYLPDLGGRQSTAATRHPTVRQLLTHHGGIMGSRMEGFERLDPDPGLFRRMPKLIGLQPAPCPPDTVFAYSNAGYTALGCLVEKMSGESFVDFVTRRILAPLRMTSTRFYASSVSLHGAVKGYEGRSVTTMPALRDIPAGALLSTASDMSRFITYVLHGGGSGVLGPAAFAEMVRRQNAHVTLDGDFAIGLGYWLIPAFPSTERFVSHAGDLPPFHCVLVTMPDQKIGLFLAANSSGAASALIPLATEITRMLYAAKTGTAPAAALLPARIRLEQEELRAHEGLYASPMGLVRVHAKGHRLLARALGLPLELVPRSGGAFTAELRPLGLFSVRIPALDDLQITFLESGGQSYLRITAKAILAGVGERFEPEPVTQDWRSRTGRYDIVPQDENAIYRYPRAVSLSDDPQAGLLLSYQIAGNRFEMPLAPASATEATIRGKGTGLGEHVTARSGDGSAFLEWSGLLLRKR